MSSCNNEHDTIAQISMCSAVKHANASFSLQQDCFTFSSEHGIRIFNAHPPALLRSLRKEQVGAIKMCSILHRSNLIFFVGATNSGKFPSNVVFIYDDSTRDLLSEITVQGSPVLNVLVDFSRIVIVQDRRIHVFSFPNPCEHICSEEIRFNPHGLAAMGGEADKDMHLLVYPGFEIGSYQMVNLKTLTKGASLAPSTRKAHLTEISQISLNTEATLIATGSTKGTVIRVFNTRTSSVLVECRRGSDPSTLHCLQFSPCSTYLAVSSDKGTMHIFAIRESEETASKRSILHQVGLVKERRNCAQFSLDSKVLACGFQKATQTEAQSLVAICSDGSYHRFSFDIEGRVTREGFDHIIQLAEEQEFWTKPFF